jgi:hypothetical protein
VLREKRESEHVSVRKAVASGENLVTCALPIFAFIESPTLFSSSIPHDSQHTTLSRMGKKKPSQAQRQAKLKAQGITVVRE